MHATYEYRPKQDDCIFNFLSTCLFFLPGSFDQLHKLFNLLCFWGLFVFDRNVKPCEICSCNCQVSLGESYVEILLTCTDKLSPQRCQVHLQQSGTSQNIRWRSWMFFKTSRLLQRKEASETYEFRPPR